MTIERTTLPEGWTVAAYNTHGKPDQLWISIDAPGFGQFAKLCTKDNERRMALALRDHAAGVGASRLGASDEARP